MSSFNVCRIAGALTLHHRRTNRPFARKGEKTTSQIFAKINADNRIFFCSFLAGEGEGEEVGAETRAAHFHGGGRHACTPRSLARRRVNHLYFCQRNQSNPLVTPPLTAYFIWRESIRPSSAAHPAGYLLHPALVCVPPPASLPFPPPSPSPLPLPSSVPVVILLPHTRTHLYALRSPAQRAQNATQQDHTGAGHPVHVNTHTYTHTGG